jgi:N-acetylglucosamine kinase-like BadF-type ATPase
MTILVGVDVGGSHTEAVVSDRELMPLARKRGPGGALEKGRILESAEVVADLVQQTLGEAKLDSAVAAAVVGSAGARQTELREKFTSYLREQLGSDCALLVTSDAAIALESAHGINPGILIASGTGSIAFARDPEGKIWRVGGLGWRHGDQGSGYAASLAALEAVQSGSRRPETALYKALRQALGDESLIESTTRLRSGDRSQVALLARTVCDAAATGDPIAHRLVHQAAEQLARHVVALVDRFPQQARPVPLALSGGMLREGSPVRDALLRLIEAASDDLRFADVYVDPPMGALAMAARIVSG